MKLDLAITGVGLMTAVGLDAAVCLHETRCGISRLTEQPIPDRAAQFISGARVMTWTAPLRERRLEILAARTATNAWHQALHGAEPATLGRVLLLVGRAESPRPGFAFPRDHEALDRWAASLGWAGVVGAELVQAGGASAQLALERAAASIGSGGADTCLIGAADSQLQLRVTRWLEDANRLKCSYLSDGLIPGEGVAFLVVEDPARARMRGALPLARVASVAHAREAATVDSRLPNTARGLTDAVRHALSDASVPARSLAAVWCDLNGESYRAREWAFTEIRVEIPGTTVLMHPADCHGDLGTASDAVLLGLATLAQAARVHGAGPLLVFSGSDGETRAATVVLASEPDPPANGVERASESVPRLYELAPEVTPLGPDDVDWRDSSDPPRAYLEWTSRQEHLEALSMLHSQRLSLLGDPEIEWPRLERTERRMLAHLDAVVAGGAESVRAVASGVLVGEEGLAFAGALALASIPHPSARGVLAAVAEAAAPPVLAGIGAALTHAAAPWIRELLATWLAHPRAELRQLALDAGSHRRELDPDAAEATLLDPDPELRAAAAEAMRRLRHAPAIAQLVSLARDEDDRVRAAALLALVCLDARRGAEICRERIAAGIDDAALQRLALCGDRADLHLFAELRLRAPEHGAVVRALGIHGAPEAVPLLLEALETGTEPVREAAMESLELLSGLRVEDRGPAAPWAAWWRAWRGALAGAARLRRGRALDLGVCLEELGDPGSPWAWRRRASWELAILGAQEASFEPDAFVARQREALGRLEREWRSSGRS